jgi:hypothetical protein
MKIDEIKTLKTTSQFLRGLRGRYIEKIKESSCDKHNMEFGGDDRFSIFKTTIFLDCHLGYYGNSGCSSMGNVDAKIATNLLNRTLNKHMTLILETMADFAAKDAASLTDLAEKELAAMQLLIDSVKQPVTETQMP